MRIIKFRAWHKAEKVMCEVDVLTKQHAFLIGVKPGKDYTGLDGECVIEAPQNGRFCKSDEFELMQYTELKDKKGKEIYEGDIVKVPEGYGGDLIYNEFIGVIQYDAPSYYVNQSANISKTGKWSDQDYKWDDLEVIGNIYQNSDVQEEDHSPEEIIEI